MKVLTFLLLSCIAYSCSKKNIKSDSVLNTSKDGNSGNGTSINVPTLPVFITKLTAQDTIKENLIEIGRFKKTACFGFCPTYEFIIYTNGVVLYNGQQHVKQLGHIYGLISETQWNQIKSKAAAINFSQLAERYPTDEREEIPDLPLTIVGINYNGIYKIVADSHSAPKELKELEDFFQNVVDQFLENYSKQE
ncbi:MAG: hypothetical protein HOP11_10630 [Saprospiraceae bacterium]|nr:hypothetical protein [Saprospiraceae bacterium]